MTELTISRPMACPFLRKTGNNKFVCSVHTSRPGLCSLHSCFRLLVHESKIKRIGKVTDAPLYFITTDPDLRRLWKQMIAGSKIPDELSWKVYV